jgi:tetratricopeptide (TPR) repeat protein
MLANCLADRGEFGEAFHLLGAAIRQQETALTAEPRHPEYRNFLSIHFHDLARTMLLAGNEAGALATIAEWTERIRDDGNWLPRAADLLAHAMNQVKDDPDQCDRCRGHLLRDTEDRIRELIRTTAGLADGKPNVQDELARLLANCPVPGLRDSSRAIALARGVTRECPQVPDAWQTLALACFRAGDLPAALEAVGTAARLRPEHPVDALLLSLIHAGRGEAEQARRAFDRASALIRGPIEHDFPLRRLWDEALAELKPPN